MTKQPFLTDFPLTVFATARRRLQSAIRQTSAVITRRSLSGYAVLFEDFLPGGFLASIDATRRQFVKALKCLSLYKEKRNKVPVICPASGFNLEGKTKSVKASLAVHFP